MATAGKIVESLKDVVKKDPSSLAIAINEMESGDKRKLFDLLQDLEKKSQEKLRSSKTNEKKRDKAEEEGRFIGRLRNKLAHLQEVFVIKTRFRDAPNILVLDANEENLTHLDENDLIKQFNSLKDFIADLETLKTLANHSQGLILLALQEKMTIAQAATKLDIPIKYAERLANFTKFAKDYPALLLTGYSMDTILKYKTAIERTIKEDENFATRLEINPEMKFDINEDEDLLEEDVYFNS